MTKNKDKENTVIEDITDLEEPIVIPSEDGIKEESKKSDEYK